MMRDDLVGGVADRRVDEDVEAARDEDGGDEAQQEEEDHVVTDERSAAKKWFTQIGEFDRLVMLQMLLWSAFHSNINRLMSKLSSEPRV